MTGERRVRQSLPPGAPRLAAVTPGIAVPGATVAPKRRGIRGWWDWLVLSEQGLPQDVRLVLRERIRDGAYTTHIIRLVASILGIAGAYAVADSNDPRALNLAVWVGYVYGACSLLLLLALWRGFSAGAVGLVTVVADTAMITAFSTTAQYNPSGWYEVMLAPVYPALTIVFVLATLLQYSVVASLLAGLVSALARWMLLEYAISRPGVVTGTVTNWGPAQIGLDDQYVLLGVIFVTGGVTATLGRQVRSILLDHATQAVRTRVIERQQDYLRRYVSPQVAQKIIEQDDEAALESTKRRVAVMFVDIRSFTPYAAVTPPEVVVDFLNRRFTEMVDVIFAHRGTLDKFLGDGLMAVFGAPVELKNPGHAALEAAADVLAAVERYNRDRRPGEPTLRIGIGVAVGEVVAGNIGSLTRREYTCIGSAVNLAARLQELCKDLGTELVVSPDVLADLPGPPRLPLRSVPGIRVRGLSDGLDVLVLGAAEPSRVSSRASMEILRRDASPSGTGGFMLGVEDVSGIRPAPAIPEVPADPQSAPRRSVTKAPTTGSTGSSGSGIV